MQILSPSTFNGFDWFLTGMLAFSTIAAFLRGIIKVAFSLGGLLLGIVAAGRYYQPLAQRLVGAIFSFPAAKVAAFLLIVMGIMIVFTVLANFLRSTVNAIGLGFFDRLFGAGFGFMRGCLFGSAAMMAVVAFMPDSGWIKTSQLAPYFLAGAHAVSFIVPEKFQQQVSTGASELLRETPELMRLHPPTRPKVY